MPNARIAEDPRIDPRIKAVMGAIDFGGAVADAESREQLLAEANAEDAVAIRDLVTAFLGMCDTEEIAPSKGLAITEHTVVSEPDGNTVNVRFIRPEGDEMLPCVYYIHGGGMQSMSCYDGNYRAWGRIIAAQGVAVAMVDFRNALVPSSADEVAPFPAGLNDCVSGVKWVAAHHAELGHRPRSNRRRRGERRGQPHPRDRATPQARRRPRPDQGSLRDVPLHRRDLAVAREPVVDREQRHPPRPAQQPRRHGLRDRGSRATEPTRLARLRDRGRRARPRAGDDQRQRVRPAP